MTPTATHAGTFKLGGELEVCRLGFGAMRLTGDGIWGEPADREQCKQVLHRALELGINLIDTADSYGPEVTEVVSVQNRYNLADRRSDDVLRQCEEDTIGFIPWAPLDAGRTELPNEIALAWLLQRSPVMLPIPGTSSVEHLEENVRAAEIDS